MAKLKMIDLGKTDQQIKAWIEPLLLKREQLHFEIKELTAEKEKLTSHILNLVGLYPDFWKESPLAKKLVAEHPFLRFLVDSDSKPTIGDAATLILQEKGSLTKKELLVELLRYGIEISEKNASTVLGTALKRDSQRRFTTLKDGRIALTKKNT